MHTHLKIVAVVFLVAGALLGCGALVSWVLFGGLAALVGATVDEGGSLGALILGMTGTAVAVLFAAVSIPSIACGWGLLKRRRWARILGIILSAVSLLHVPAGTVFGVYALWVLLSKRTEELFGD